LNLQKVCPVTTDDVGDADHVASASGKPAVPSAASVKTPAAPKGKGKKRTESTLAPAAEPAVADLTASTSAIKLDDTPTTTPSEIPTSTTDAEPVTSSRGVELLPDSGAAAAVANTATQPRPVRGAQRDGNSQRVAEDPKITPRVGNFWTHDQRLNEGGNTGEGYPGGRQMPFFRGRAMPRGAFRGGLPRGGRGRGGFFPNGRGGFVNGGPSRSVELSAEEGKEEGSSKLAMDREFELAEARDKARSAPRVPVSEPTESVEAEATETTAVQIPTAPAAERRWGHEGYETLAGPDHFRGRGRGRGIRGGRGGVNRRSL
jgi:hypothetical protein